MAVGIRKALYTTLPRRSLGVRVRVWVGVRVGVGVRIRVKGWDR